MFPDIPKPVAKKRPVTLSQVGKTRSDDYAWLKDAQWRDVMADPAKLDTNIRAHLNAENLYCEAMLAPTKALQDTLFKEMKGRIKDDDSSVPAPDGPYAYSHRFRPGDQHGVYIRTARDAPNDQTNEIILLDADALAANHSYFDLGSVSHTRDHKYLAYALDTKGSEKYAVIILDVTTGKPLDVKIENTAGSVEWAQDNATLYWVQRDENERPSYVYRQNVLTKGSKPEQIFAESDPGFFVGIGCSDNANFVEISTHSHTTSETWLIDSPNAMPALVSARREGIEYDLHEHADDFYILTNADEATDFKIMRAKQSALQSDNWTAFVDHTQGTLIIGMETYSGHLVRLERSNALPRIIVRDLSTGEEHSIDFDEGAYSLGLSGGYEYDTPWMRFTYSSPTTPGQVFDYNMVTRERVLRKTGEVPSGHNPKDYEARRISITARDGADIPVTVLMRAGQTLDSRAPLLLYGYGSYGITIPAAFRTSIFSLIDRGFVFAIAHIRGGMAKGYQWYLDGKLEHKQRTFDDFVDAGRALCDQGYSAQGRLICHGGSAGGLLVGAALNQAPELFAGAIAAVPFVDVLNTMSDESLPLTPPEWPEWGNPLADASAYDRIASYCPYENVSAKAYPAILITAGLTDPRVTYWEPAKWAAKLRDNQTGPAPIMLKTNMDAGHQGESGRYDSLKETALEYSFALNVVGLQ